MRTTLNNITQTGLSTLESFPKEVKETLFTDNIRGRHKIFSTADLWNIQRQTKYRIQRRFI
jgi:hypothetical protein